MNPTPEEFFKEHDAQCPPPTQLLRDIVFASGGWTPGDGPTYGAYNDRRAGHHCAWSCKWAVGGVGTLDPGAILQIVNMTTAELIAELFDIIDQSDGLGAVKAGRALARWYRAEYDSGYRPQSWLKEARTAVGAGRAAYQEYTSFWAPPAIAGYGGGGFGKLMRVVARPGWSSVEDIIQKARSV